MRRLIEAIVIVCLCGCGQDAGHGTAGRHARMAQAKVLIAEHCAACHRVPGVAVAIGRVGPSLAEVGQQQIIAGHFLNTPDTLARWIQQPQQLLPGDVMPDTGLSFEQARLIADYLYTLEQQQ
jgi:cytochrome c